MALEAKRAAVRTVIDYVCSAGGPDGAKGSKVAAVRWPDVSGRPKWPRPGLELAATSAHRLALARAPLALATVGAACVLF